MFTDSDSYTVSRSYMYGLKFAIAPTFSTMAIATVVSATAFFLIQQKEEYQKCRAEEEKEQALKYQYLEQRIISL